MKNIAIAGAGYWGKNLIRNYSQLGVLKLVCDKNEAFLIQYKQEFPDIETCIAFNDILKNDRIQGVVISTPAETHFHLAREVLLAEKHVYVEKPLVLQEDEAEDLINLAKERNLVLMVGHLLQYHPVFKQLKTLVAQGELGRINYIYSHRLNLGKIRREENILWSFAPHDISMILALAGEEPENIVATGGNYLHKKIADVTTTHLEFQSGLKAHIFVSWLHPFKEQKLVVVGDRKMAVFDDMQPWPDKLLLYPHEIKWQNNIPTPAKATPERVSDIPHMEPLRLECEHFLDCMKNGKTPLTDGNEGLKVLRVLNASQRSLNENSKKISIESENHMSEHGKSPLLSSGHLSDLSAKHDNDYYAHPTSVVDDNVHVGTGTKIWHFSHIISGSKIGEQCNIGQNVMIGPDVTIGDGCKIQNNVSVYKGVSLEDEVFCGPSVVFTNVHNPRAHIRRMDEIRPTLVKKGATIGANATIICGTTIGSYSFIGAGAVVTKDVPEYSLVTGNPATHTGWICCCGIRLTDISECVSCGKRYVEHGKGLSERDS